MKKAIIILVGIAIFLGIALFLMNQYHVKTWSILGYGTVEAREIHLGSQLGGRVEKVYVKESDMVKANTLLVSLDNRELKAKEAEALAALESAKATLRELLAGYRPELIEQARARVQEQREYLKKLKAGPRKEEIEAQKARMKNAAADYQHAKKTYERVLKQVQQGVLSQQELDNAQHTLEMTKEKLYAEKKSYELMIAGTRIEDIEMAMARLSQASAELKRLEAGPRKEELDRARARIREIQARVERIRIQMEECNIFSPTSGRIEICDLEPGDILAPGRTAVTLLKPNDLWVKIYLKEYELDRVHIGQDVVVLAETSRRKKYRSVFLNFLSSLVSNPPAVKTFPGRIVHIASKAEFTPRNVQTTHERGQQVFSVKVEIFHAKGKLLPGISVVVKEKEGKLDSE